jgi:hypothetical protein
MAGSASLVALGGGSQILGTHKLVGGGDRYVRPTGVVDTDTGIGTHSGAYQVMARACTLTGFHVKNRDAAVGGGNTVVTVYLNGNPTALTVTFNGDAQDTIKSISGQSVAIASGDTLSIRINSLAGSGTPVLVWGIVST